MGGSTSTSSLTVFSAFFLLCWEDNYNRASQLCLAAPTTGDCPVFPSDHVWNTRVDCLPVLSNSIAMINTMNGASTGLHPDFGSGLWDGGPIGIPYITVPGSQTKYTSTFYYQDESDSGLYAIPLNAPVEGGSDSTGDRHVISVDVDNCILYEIYDAHNDTVPNAWYGGSGAIYDLKAYHMRPDGWTSADAAGLAIFPGLIKYDDILKGSIDHAIRFTADMTRNSYVWPATHRASSYTGSQYPAMGQRFRLKASFDISSFSRTNQIILSALKKYGMIVADNGSNFFIGGAPDERWDNDDLHKLQTRVRGSDFEAVDVRSLILSPASARAKQICTRSPTRKPITVPTPKPRRTPSKKPSKKPVRSVL